MSDLDRNQFIDRWHAAVAHELALAAKPTADVREFANILKTDLKNNPTVARLATNPLLAAMICALNRDRRSHMPESQHELLEALCHMLLHRRERESGLDVSKFPASYRDLTYPQKKVLVQQLARELMGKELSALPAEDAARVIGETLATMRGHSSKTARAVVDSLVERSGMLREKSPGVIDFVHNTFKEFLTAEAFVQDGDATGLAQHAASPAWEDVLLFAAAGSTQASFTSTLIRTVLYGDGRGRRSPRLSARSGPDLRQRFLAARLRAVSQRLDPQLDEVVNALGPGLKRPTTMGNAAALSTLGNAALGLLRYGSRLSARQAAPSVRALRLIGTPEASAELMEYARETRLSVIAELAQGINPLQIGEVVRRISCNEDLPPTIRRQIVDISPLAGLTTLTSLDMSGTQLTDVTPLAGLTALTSLNLRDTQITDVGPLAGLTALTSLNLMDTQITDMGPLAGLTALTSLELAGCTQIADVGPLEGLTALTSLYLMRTQITDVRPLDGLNALAALGLSGTPITDVGPLEGLTALTSLYLSRTLIADVRPLAGLTALTSLYLWATQVTDVRPLAGLTTLTSLYLSFNPITDVEPLAGFTALTQLDLSGTQITDIGPLAGLTALTSLELAGTQITDVGPLAGLTALTSLDLAGTQITDVRPLVRLASLREYKGPPIKRKR